MATVKEYISEEINTFQFPLSDIQIEGLLIENKLNGSLEYDSTQVYGVKRLWLAVIPKLLLMPSTIQEGGYTISRNKDGIKAYYDILASELGETTSTGTSKPKLRSVNVW